MIVFKKDLVVEGDNTGKFFIGSFARVVKYEYNQLVLEKVLFCYIRVLFVQG